MISRKQILGIGLAVGILLAGGTGMASAASAPTTTPPATTAAAAPTCDVVVVGGKTIPATPIPATPSPVPCLKLVRGGLPSGAPQTGGGGMAAEVSSWG
ncbi:MAG TPA: hypothetical protein VH333_09075 [Pseudonocardiaceae bacterium]|nr:hypothetical protein [Pseudonocardiaceae bacterium]